MNWKYHLITLAVFVAAIYTSALAPVVGSIVLSVGIVLEGVFWSRLFNRAKRTQ
jgi:hypothetical protein